MPIIISNSWTFIFEESATYANSGEVAVSFSRPMIYWYFVISFSFLARSSWAQSVFCRTDPISSKSKIPNLLSILEETGWPSDTHLSDPFSINSLPIHHNLFSFYSNSFWEIKPFGRTPCLVHLLMVKIFDLGEGGRLHSIKLQHIYCLVSLYGLPLSCSKKN